ncbi:MAG: hypothetical protein ACHREM_04045 [Polyangiales bacterium]
MKLGFADERARAMWDLDDDAVDGFRTTLESLVSTAQAELDELKLHPVPAPPKSGLSAILQAHTTEASRLDRGMEAQLRGVEEGEVPDYDELERRGQLALDTLAKARRFHPGAPPSKKNVTDGAWFTLLDFVSTFGAVGGCVLVAFVYLLKGDIPNVLGFVAIGLVLFRGFLSATASAARSSRSSSTDRWTRQNEAYGKMVAEAAVDAILYHCAWKASVTLREGKIASLSKGLSALDRLAEFDASPLNGMPLRARRAENDHLAAAVGEATFRAVRDEGWVTGRDDDREANPEEDDDDE